MLPRGQFFDWFVPRDLFLFHLYANFNYKDLLILWKITKALGEIRKQALQYTSFISKNYAILFNL